MSRWEQQFPLFLDLLRWSFFVVSVQDSFDIDFLPSVAQLESVRLGIAPADSEGDAAEAGGGCQDVGAIAYLTAMDDEPPADGWTWDQLEELGFTGKVGQTVVFPAADRATNVLIGIGEASEATADDFREAGAAFARAIGKKTSGCVSLEERGTKEQVQAFVEGALLARYGFNTFTDEERKTPFWHSFTVAGAALSDQEVSEALESAREYAKAAFVARDLTNCPPGHLNPSSFTKVVAEAGKRFGFEVAVTELEELKEMGLGGLVGVNRGSAHPARLIQLTYHPAAPEVTDEDDLSTLALVGKGITFDSGGLSLKPASAMIEMKMDMGGAAAVVGTFSALAALGTKIAVRGWLAVTDNMISGDSLRVGEVVTARNGKTVEINNTDAEGRLVLMDALSLAVEAKPDWIVDIATLTGAQIVALGNEVAAVMGNNPELVREIEEAGTDTGEQVWELPLQKRYLKILESKIADIANANMSNRAAGTITAGLFLSQFVDETAWAHLDIAGPMSSSGADRWLVPGATGFGARLLLDLTQRLTSI